jgi:uncharacterized flavoprotein (TIGR03862 family)
MANLIIVGAGPAGLMAAETFAAEGASVTVYERMASPARKFLLAGRGGLNITHSEPLQSFLSRYGDAAPRLQTAIEAYPPTAVREWCHGLGQETFVGSSGRVFPSSFKTSPLLRAWLRRLDTAGVRLAFRHRWTGWNVHGDAIFETPSGVVTVPADATVLALGGASWPRLGADGSWTGIMAREGVAVTALRPANCGFAAGWSAPFRDRFEGTPLKRIALSFAGRTVPGEAVVTRDGLEGGAVYALSAPLRETIAANGEAILSISLRPGQTAADVRRALEAPRGKQSLSNVLRKALKLPPVAIGLLHETVLASGGRLADLNVAALGSLIVAVPVRLTAPMPLAGAISTAGGVAFEEIDESFMLRRRPGTFVAGEMLDWEAPTGGYLLQASLSTGAAAARGALAWLSRR